jgi:hypothetical protein
LVGSRKPRQRRLKAACARCLVPADHASWCFNYFSASHFVVHCQQRARCFKCRLLGHRSFTCPSRRSGAEDDLPINSKVWRPIDCNMCSVPTSSSRPRPSFPWRLATVAGELNTRAGRKNEFKSKVWRWKKVPSVRLEVDASCS